MSNTEDFNELAEEARLAIHHAVEQFEKVLNPREMDCQGVAFAVASGTMAAAAVDWTTYTLAHGWDAKDLDDSIDVLVEQFRDIVRQSLNIEPAGHA